MTLSLDEVRLKTKSDHSLQDVFVIGILVLQSSRDMQLFESVAIKSIPQKAGLQWQFSGAFYFATVVITTVGESEPRHDNSLTF